MSRGGQDAAVDGGLIQGHGASTLRHTTTATLDRIPRDLAALIRTMGIQHVQVIGHGLGAQMAQELTHRHPRTVGRVVLIAGPVHHPIS